MKKLIKGMIKHPLFSGSMIMIIGSNSANFLNYIYHFLMGRLLGPSGYGELVALISFIGLVGMFPGSLSLVITKYISSSTDRKEINNLISWLRLKVLQVSLLVLVVIVIFSSAITSFLNISNSIYLLLIGFYFLFSLPTVLNRSILQGLLKFKEMILSILVENCLKLLVGILLVYLGFYLFGATIGLIVASLVGWYITFHYLKGYIKKNPSIPSNLSQMTLFAIPVILQTIAITSLYTSDVILVKHFFSSHEAGLYASLSTLGKIIFFGAGPIGTVMFPIVSKRYAQGGTYKKIFVYSFIITLLFSLAILIIYWLMPQLAITLLYGSAYLEGSSLLVLFGLFITLFTLSSLIISFNLSLGKTKVVVFPLIAAISQIVAIWYIHPSINTVILISTIVTALLLICLSIYSIYNGTGWIRNKLNIGDSTGI